MVWTAYFTRIQKDCEGPPVMFTLPAYTLTVRQSPPEEQAAAKKEQEEEERTAAEENKEKIVVAAGSVSIDGSVIEIQGTGKGAVKLVGRVLLGAAHGRLSAILTVLQSAPAPSQTHSESVELLWPKVHRKAKK